MTETSIETRERYLAAVRELISQIKEWLAPTNVTVHEKSVRMREESLGEYDAPALEISDPAGRLLVNVVPAGAAVIGAKGRIDLEGRRANESLLLFGDGGPVWTVERPGLGTQKHRMLKGVDKAGWYWIESPILKLARRVEKDWFLDLLSGVSDYELAG